MLGWLDAQRTYNQTGAACNQAAYDYSISFFPATWPWGLDACRRRKSSSGRRAKGANLRRGLGV